MKLIFSHKSLLLVGLVLNIGLIIYVTFIAEGGFASVQQGDWKAIVNEVPMSLLFFLAAVIKPYLMIWSKCRKDIDIISLAATVMLATTVIAGVIILMAEKNMTRDLTMYINWAILWGASYYFVLAPRQTPASD